LTERKPTEDLKCGRSRDGESAVSAFHGAVSVMKPAAVNFFHAERLQADAGEDDVGNAVERADFVEVDGFRVLAVNLAFGDGDAVEDGDRVFLDEPGELAAFDERADLGVSAAFLVVMMVVLVVAVFVRMLVAVLVLVLFVMLV